jgi:cytochrome P450
MTIYHQLMSPEAYKAGTVPSAGSLYEEAQALMFAGADTTGNTLMLGTFYLLRSPDMYQKLKAELRSLWPDLAEQPSLRELEQASYLNAVIKEALRMSSGVVSGLLRVVPKGGAIIAKHHVPAGAVVSCGSTFVHYNPDIFPSPHEFQPGRWLHSTSLDQWLVAFSRGPRSCLGINLAWLELRLSFAHFFRRFEMELEASSPGKLEVLLAEHILT